MKMYDTPRPVVDYLNVRLECDCGMTHYAPIKAVVIRSGAFHELPAYMRQLGYAHPYLLCDATTYRIAGKSCEDILNGACSGCTVHILSHLGYDEATLGEIVINKPDGCDLMIACGTGSITDITRYASFKLSLPCFTVVTAAPMDGFSASVGIMNVNGLKATMPAHSTEVLFADPAILAGAPFRMTLAGFSDLIAKLNAINDWRLDALINGAHHCKKIDELVCAYTYDILGKTDRIKAHDDGAVGDLLNALILTGAVISLYGSSRPISGAEHHMSHYWELLGDRRGKPYAMHGEQAGVGTVLALMLARELFETNVDFDRARASASDFDRAAWEADIRTFYGAAADRVIADEVNAGFASPEARLARLSVIEENYTEVRRLLGGLYPWEKLYAQLKALGCPADPADIGLDAATLKETLMHCKETRPRYTVLRLAADLGVLDEVSDRVIARLWESGRVLPTPAEIH